MGLKVDLSGVKNFFVEKGERVGMLACLATAGVLVGYSVVHSMSARSVPGTSNSYQEAFNNRVRDLRSKQNNGEQIAAANGVNVNKEWDERQPTFPWTRLSDRSDRANNKRTNPRALAPLVDPDGNHIRMDYVRGSYFVFDINQQFKTATVVKDAKAPDPGKKIGFPFFPKPAPNAPRNQAPTVHPLIATQPLRMVVVHATFPLSEQIQEFRKAFRLLSDYELFQSKDLPRFLGMNIMKAEVAPGKPLTWTPLVTSSFDGTNEKVDADPALMALMRQAIFDDAEPPYTHALVQGLAMPLPKLATLPPSNVYPAVDLAGIPPLEEALPDGMNPDGKMKFGGAAGKGFDFMPGGPGMGRAGGADVDLAQVPWSKLAPELKDKFTDGFYVLDPLGKHPDPDEPKAAPGAVPVVPDARQLAASGSFYKSGSEFAAARFWDRYPQPPVPPHLLVGGEGKPMPTPMPPMTTVKPYDAVIRFIDPDVKPGKTYKYSIQVRIANPNYGKKSEVAFAALADVKELKPAAPVETPTITIPTEYFLFAIDQKPENPKVVGGSDDKDAKPEQVAIQIHRWVDVTGDRDSGAEHVVGDWAIAERLLLQRGDPVGRMVNVEIPVWDKKRQTYDLGSSMTIAMPEKKGGIKLPPKGLGGRPMIKKEEKDDANGAELAASGIPVDFAETAPPAVLIDFDGGKKEAKFPGDSRTTTDHSASNLLILRADGKLIVRNNRDDSDPTSDGYTARQKRLDEWKAKVGLFRAANPNPAVIPGGNAPNPFFIPRKAAQ